MQEFYFKDINSTQEYAKKLYLENKFDFVVYADSQRAGHGRNGKEWWSPNGGLWFSFDMEFNDNGLFTMAIGVAVREVLEEVYKIKVELKWPNDLIVYDKKVGGIICEKVNDRVAVGIGINTNNKEIFNKEIASTFIHNTEKTVDNYRLMNEIITRCKKYMNSKSEDIIESFRRNMAFRGRKCFVSILKKEVNIIDINSNGYLLVENDEGIKEINSGEINVCI